MRRKLTPVKAIRAHCIECCGGSFKDVRECPTTDCRFYSWRLGTNPARKGIGGSPLLMKQQ